MVFWRFQNLKCSHTTAYDISVCQRMIIRSHTQIYVRGTLGIRRVRCYTQRLNNFLDMFRHTLEVRYSYVGTNNGQLTQNI